MALSTLVSSAWLAAHLQDPGVRILDASYFVPGGIPPALQQYREGHIPGARFFDINAVADTAKTKEHAFPDAATFAAKVGALGVGNQHHVIAYDHLGGTCAAARVWFMFKAFGHDKVSVLDGGRKQWLADRRPMTGDALLITPEKFSARPRTDAVKAKDEMLANIAAGRFQVVDARGRGRFEGTEPEPRAGLRSGHIPASKNVPFLSLISPETHLWRAADAIGAIFADAGVDLAKPLAATCGSGVTACTLALGAYLVGKTDTAIYDGSWLEWGGDPSLPLAAGNA